jgi:hypothetical protein
VRNGVDLMNFFSSDACLTGCGGWFKCNFFHTVFPEFILDATLHINCLELLSIIVCLKMWHYTLEGKEYELCVTIKR